MSKKVDARARAWKEYASKHMAVSSADHSVFITGFNMGWKARKPHTNLGKVECSEHGKICVPDLRPDQPLNLYFCPTCAIEHAVEEKDKRIAELEELLSRAIGYVNNGRLEKEIEKALKEGKE